MRLTWLSVNASYSHASLALPLIHGSCSGVPGVVWQQVESALGDDPSALARRVADSQPDVLAATVYLFNRELVLKVVRRVHALLPQCRILLGGPEFLGDNEDFLRAEPAICAVLRGEGEGAFPEWLARWEHPELWGDIPGLCWLAGRRYCDNSLAVLSADAFAAAPGQTASVFFPGDGPFVQLETSRGCHNSCAFCTSAVGEGVRLRPLEAVRAELDIFLERGVRDVRVLDRTFNGNLQRALVLLALFGDYPFRFHLEIHPALVASALLEALCAFPAGRLHVEAGVQSCSEEALGTSRRRGGAARSLAGLRTLCGLRNVEVHADLLAGLPDQTWSGLLQDVRQLVAAGPDEIQLELLKILPGTPLAGDAGKLGITHAPDTPYEVLETPHFSARELARAASLSRLIDRFYNPLRLGPIFRAALERAPDFLERFLGFLQSEGALDAPQSLKRRLQAWYGFATGEGDSETARQLERAWIVCGLSPEHGLAAATRWSGPVPPEADLVEGADSAGPERKSVIFCLEQSPERTWFVFNRTKAPRQLQAVYRS